MKLIFTKKEFQNKALQFRKEWMDLIEFQWMKMVKKSPFRSLGM
jgi:hypothetical protein